MKKVVIINSGLGNVQSVFNAVSRVSDNVEVIDTVDALMRADLGRIILPGVGAVGKYLKNLNKSGFCAAIKKLVIEDKVPLLGICVGMQALATTCIEFGTFHGMNLIPGTVQKIDRLTSNTKVPHVGWNQVLVTDRARCLADLNNCDFYFVHSNCFKCKKEFVVARTQYGAEFASIIGHKNIFGVQFHPEKSSTSGEMLLRGFVERGYL